MGPFGLGPGAPGGGDLGELRPVPAVGVEKTAMARRIQQPLAFELAVDFDQRISQPAQQADADRLIVDEGARTAVGVEHAAQDNAVVAAVDPMLGHQGTRIVAGRNDEFGGDRGGVGAVAHQLGVGAEPERETERVEQDRLAGPGFPGQHAKTRLELDIQTTDQDDVADGKRSEHSDRRAYQTLYQGFVGFGRTGLFSIIS